VKAIKKIFGSENVSLIKNWNGRRHGYRVTGWFLGEAIEKCRSNHLRHTGDSGFFIVYFPE
jgi:hypothetical protein